MFAILLVCKSEQAALAALGYTKLTWDNDSGFEQKPWSFIKSWSFLTNNEKDAAKILGFTKKSWEKNRRPRIYEKKWDDMTSCSDGEDPSARNFSVPSVLGNNCACKV